MSARTFTRGLFAGVFLLALVGALAQVASAQNAQCTSKEICNKVFTGTVEADDKLLLVSGVSKDQAGFKHLRATAGCATAASAGAVCDTTVTWTTTFPDTGYTIQCQGIGVTSGVPAEGAVVTRTASAITFRTVAITAAAAQFTTVECVAVHD